MTTTMLTAYSITDEQIIELRNSVDISEYWQGFDVKTLCNLALLAPGGVGMKHEYEVARFRIAALLNARQAATTG